MDESGPRYTIRDASFALKEQTPMEWVIENLAAVGSLGMAVGSFGSKKTYSFLYATVCIAMGKPFAGLATKQCKGLIIDEESGERRMARRLGEVIRGAGGDETTPVEFVSLPRFNLRNNNDVILMQTLIEGTGAKFVLIDALVDLMPGGDENSVKDTQPVFMALRQITEATEATILLIHHTGKAGDYRGSSAIGGAVDWMLMVESKDGNPIVTFETRKTRDSESKKFAARATWLGDIFLLDVADADQTPGAFNKGQKYVIQYLSQNADATTTEIKDHADKCAPTTARTAIYSLVDRGYVVRTDSGGPGDMATWDLSEKGKQWAILYL